MFVNYHNEFVKSSPIGKKMPSLVTLPLKVNEPPFQVTTVVNRCDGNLFKLREDLDKV
jgi:hypothetical protein